MKDKHDVIGASLRVSESPSLQVSKSPSLQVETYHITPMKNKHDVIGASQPIQRVLVVL